MRSYPQITRSEWNQVGEGFNALAFESPLHPGVMLKLVRREMGSADKVEHEFQASRAAYAFGLPTPQVYEIVRDGNNHGYLCQVVYNKKSFGRLCADAPDRIPEFAAMMANYAKELHATPIWVSQHVPNCKVLLMDALDNCPLITAEQREQMKILVQAMPNVQTCMHGDFQPGNLLLASGKPYWIDMGWLAQGWYMMDLAHLYKMMVVDSVIPQVQDLTHMNREQMILFWTEFAKAYTGEADVEALNRELRPYAALDLVRTSYLHPMSDPTFLEYAKNTINDLLNNNA